MATQLQLPPGKLNDHEWRQNFGMNVRICLQHMGMTALSLATRAAFKEDEVNQILAGRLSLSNDDVEAIRLEIGLNTNDLIMDYMDNGRRNDELLAKLKVAGRIKPPQPVAEVTPEPARPPVPEEPAPASETLAEEPKIVEKKTMANTNTVVWNDNDIIGIAGNRKFNLRDKELRREVAKNIKALRDKLYPGDTNLDLFARIKKTKKNAAWLSNLSNGSATVEGTDIETFAEFFGVSVLSLLTGEMPSDVDGDDPESLTEQAPQPEVAHAQPEVAAATLPATAEEAAAPEPVVPVAELTAQQPVVAASAEEVPSSGSTDDSQTVTDTESGQFSLDLDEHVQRVAAFQEHFKQRLLSAEFDLADGVTLRSFLAATQAAEVDWCSLFYTMTREGTEILAKIEELAGQVHPGDNRLALQIMERMLMRKLHKQ